MLEGRRVAIYSHFPLEFGGGGETSMSSIASGLGSLGYDVEYCVDSLYRGITRLSPEAVRRSVNGFAYTARPFAKYSPTGTSVFFRRLPSISGLSLDTVHLVAVDRPPPPLFLAEARASRAPIAVLLHGLSPADHPSDAPSLLVYQSTIRSYLHGVIRLGLWGEIPLQVFNTRTRDLVRSYGLSDDQISIIPSGAHFADASRAEAVDRFEVLFLGRIDRLTKGIDTLAETLDMLLGLNLSDLHFSIAGSGPDQEALRRRFARRPEVSVLGFVDDRHKAQLLSQADLLLVTSRVEPFSMVCVEALASGIPIVTTPVSGPASIVETGRDFGMVAAPGASGLASAVLLYLNRWKADPQGYLRERGQRRTEARAEFSREMMVSRYAALVERVRERWACS